MHRPFLRLGIALASALVLMSAAPLPAYASFSNTADTTWMTNGIVYAITDSADTVYVGGKFTSLRRCPTGVSCPNGTIATVDVGAFDATTGDGIRAFHVDVAGDGAVVYALALLNGELYIGGKFTSVNGQPRENLAAVDPSTGALDTAFDPVVGTDTTSYVRGLLSHDDMLYVAGKFGSIDGSPRAKLAAFDASGTLDPSWRPRSAGLPRTFTPTCDGGSLIIGGAFTKVAGTDGTFQDRRFLAIVDAHSGALDPWTPDNANLTNGLSAYDLAATCDALFVGMGSSNHLMRIDLSDDFGNIVWDLHTGGNVQTVALDGDRLLFGGHFANTPDGPDSNGKVKRIRFATVDLNGNALNDWTPEFDGKFYGPWDILVRADQVWIGGQFTQVSGVSQYFIARFTDAP